MTSGSLFAALRRTAQTSRVSLGKIGDGDWTPQDSAHLTLVRAVELALAEETAPARSPLPWSWDEDAGVVRDANGETVIEGMGYDGLWTALTVWPEDIAFLIEAVNRD